MPREAGLSSELRDWQSQIREIAINNGLDFYEVIFEMVSEIEINELAALGGFPKRYPHWRFGMELDRLAKTSTYGVSKIYELVINTDPCYAYLLTSNTLLHQKLVMAHVFGHSDFFKNNHFFSGTNSKMLDIMANHAVRIRCYQDEFGSEVIEEFIDICLSLDNLLDYRSIGLPQKIKAPVEEPDIEKLVQFETPNYMENYVNPREQMEAQKAQLLLEKQKRQEKIPERPERDILHFLLQYAPLEPWQQDCLAIIRDEAYYFAPQGQTKIMNEGWATYWHSQMMTNEILSSAEVVDYACVHGGTVAVQPGGLNPYKIGLELFRNITLRWDKGQFGREWEECTDYRKRNSISFNAQKDRIRKLFLDFVNEKFKEGYDAVFLGHSHVFENTQTEGGKIYLNLGSWFENDWRYAIWEPFGSGLKVLDAKESTTNLSASAPAHHS